MLRATYTENRAKLTTSSFGVPLFLNSFEQNSRVTVDVYGVFDFPFNSVVAFGLTGIIIGPLALEAFSWLLDKLGHPEAGEDCN